MDTPAIAENAQLIPLTDREYQLMRDLVYEKFGINLGECKRSLIVGRLHKVLKENGFSSFSDYYDYITADRTGRALTRFIDRISTNHTFFYREKDHFEYFLETALPALVNTVRQQGGRKLHLWCPGCSSGEEPYTLAMLMLEHFGREIGSWDAGILATDISSQVLDKARAGVYEEESVALLPRSLAVKYFQRLPEGGMAVADRVKDLVLFRRLNLMRPEYPFKSRFNAIFCRNVMIYFDQPTRQALVSRFHRYLEEEGYLFIGHSETLGREDAHFRYVRPAIYRRTQP